MTRPTTPSSPPPGLPVRRLLLSRSLTRALPAPDRSAPVKTLSLAEHYRLGQQLQQSGARLHLLSLVNAAVRHLVQRYFTEYAVVVEMNAIQTAEDRFPATGLGHHFERFCTSYALPELLALEWSRHAPYRQALLAELLLLDLYLDNRALAPERPLFAPTPFVQRSAAWRHLLDDLCRRLHRQEPSVWGRDLRSLLRLPLQAAPDSLDNQVRFMLDHWAAWLPTDLVEALAVGRAVVLEETRPRLAGPGPPTTPDLTGSRDLPAAFSADRNWMPQAVLLAKSIYVWLDQLSRRYQRSIRTLHEIPDEELDRLAGWGFTALWLIGIWERSEASRKIKQLRGNPEAEASAYALYAYRVSVELGGDDALADLESRCQARGIRLACDVVPNHTGIDSEWVRQHPDWFIQSHEPPYPGYRFTGPDLCTDDAVSIRIEDGYWDHSDAAVVYQHIDHHSGRHRYIYHGNDGTQMPWNDTAQLNFLLPEVRRAMSDLIIDVARRFRLIRFDAAMTLARKHYRRLWFPPPGGSAGVPSRSAACMDDAAFDRAFPREFWRELVDRINREVPDTLLIAEAFWLMESYFVRSLGMHRVYNSAFMNLLKNGENAKFRRMLKETLAFNPEILKRYVNFMNNPDEATAVAQFGKGDKYFGVAVLLATLPGLPMFGHGQFEGYEERYGMEYRRAYHDEQPDEGFIAYHERQIVPLLQRRQLFADVENFRMYDLNTPDGVDDNVIAYSNGAADQRFLVVYNNSPQPIRGRLQEAAPMASGAQEGRPQPAGRLTEHLRIDAADGDFCRFRDHFDGRDYLQPLAQVHQGLAVRLDGYQVHVFYGFENLVDEDGRWAELYTELQGQPVADLDQACQQLQYRPLWESWLQLLAPERLKALAGLLSAPPLTTPTLELIRHLDADRVLCQTHLAELFGGSPMPAATTAPALENELNRLSRGLTLLAQLADGPTLLTDWTGREGQPGLAYPLFCWRLLDLLRLQLPVVNLWRELQDRGLDAAWATLSVGERPWHELLPLLQESGRLTPLVEATEDGFRRLVTTPRFAAALGINQHQGQTWFHRERMQALVAGLALQAIWLAPDLSREAISPILERFLVRSQRLEDSAYLLDKFLDLG